MRPAFRDPEDQRLIMLPLIPKTRRGKTPGTPRYGSQDQRIVQTESPSPPVPRFTHCPQGCQCPRCQLDIAQQQYQYAACEVFRELAGQK